MSDHEQSNQEDDRGQAWDGINRRRGGECNCQRIEDLDAQVAACKARFEADISTLNDQVGAIGDTVHMLGQEVHGLRSDVHNMTSSVHGMKESLDTIAGTLKKLADFPETWNNIRGFWRVVRFLRDNLVPVGLPLAGIGYAIYLFGKNTGMFP